MPKYTYTPTPDREYYVADGDYWLTIDGIESRWKDGSEQTRIKMTVNGRGCEVFEVLTFNEKSFWKVNQFLHALGIKPKPGDEIVIDEKLKGRQLRATLKIESFESKKQQNPDGTPKKLKSSRVDRFIDADTTVATLNERDAANKTAPATDAGDDDVPF